MINAEILPNGNLRLSADPRDRSELASLADYEHWGDVDVLLHGMEHYWANGKFRPFDAGQANPHVGLTEAPCIAETMHTDEDGRNEIVGRLWWYPEYELKCCIHEMVQNGYVVFTLAP